MEHGWSIVAMSILDNLDIYLEVLFILSLLYYFLVIKNIISDVFDPLFIGLVGCTFAISVPIYMKIVGLFFSDQLLVQVLGTELSMLIGLLISSKSKKIIKEPKVEMSQTFLVRICSVYGCVYFMILIMQWWQYGIPLFDFSNHQEAAMKMGIISQLGNAALPILIFGLYGMLFIYHKKKYILLMILVGITLLLSGSKGSFLSFAVGLYLFKVYSLKVNKSICEYRKIYWLIGSLIIFAALFTIVMSDENLTLYEAVGLLLMRLANTGDIFAYIYIYDGTYINKLLENNNFYNLYLAEFAYLFHLIPWQESASPVGFQIMRDVFSVYDVSIGPNCRYNVFFFLCFGYYGSMLASFMLGLVIGGYTKYSCSNITFSNPYLFLMYLQAYVGVCGMLTDINTSTGILLRGVFLNSILLAGIYLFTKIKTTKIMR